MPSDSAKRRAPAQQLEKIEDILQLERHEGKSRVVFFDRVDGYCYKIFERALETQIQFELETLRDELRREERLNDCYSYIYGGRYAKYASVKVIELPRHDGTLIPVVVMPLIEHATRLGNDEKIPGTLLQELSQVGLLPYDAKKENFIVVVNEYGEKDVLPIDAKFIAQSQSLSPRTSHVRRLLRASPDKSDLYDGVHTSERARDASARVRTFLESGPEAPPQRKLKKSV